MKINWSKVLLGGLVAGIVMLAIDFVTNTYILGARYMAEMDAFKPGLSAEMARSGMVGYLVMDLILGVALVWLYAAIRPRFGPGPRTAFYAALLVWVVSCVAYYGYLQIGMMSGNLWGMAGIAGLIALTAGAMAGAALYSEGTNA